MRENRLYGSEGGAVELNRPSLPLFYRLAAETGVNARQEESGRAFAGTKPAAKRHYGGEVFCAAAGWDWAA